MDKGNLRAIIAGVGCGLLGLIFAINQATSLNEPASVYSPLPVHPRTHPAHIDSLKPRPSRTLRTPVSSYQPPVVSVSTFGSHHPVGKPSRTPVHHPTSPPTPRPTPTPTPIPAPQQGVVCKLLGALRVGVNGHLLVCSMDASGRSIWTLL